MRLIVSQFIAKLFSDPDRLFHDSTLMLASSVLANVFQLLFQMMVGRWLSTGDFGDFGLMLSVLLIFSGAIQTSIIQYTAQFRAQDASGLIAVMSHRAARKLLIVCGPVLAIMLVLSKPTAGLFHLAGIGPVVVGAMIFAISLFFPILNGVLQGLQKFGWVAANSIIGCIIRLVCGVLFVLVLGWGASGALLATVVQLVAMAGVALYVVFPWVKLSGADIPTVDTSAVYRYFWPVLLSTALMQVVMSIDQILVKYLFDRELAGAYTQATSIARYVTNLSLVVVAVMFAKVVDNCHGEGRGLVVFGKLVSICLLLSVGAAVICTVFPQIPVRILFGTGKELLYPLVRAFGWVFAPMPVFCAAINYLMACKSFAYVGWLCGLVLLYVVAMMMWHSSLMTVVGVVSGFAYCITGVMCLCVVRDQRMRVARKT